MFEQANRVGKKMAIFRNHNELYNYLKTLKIHHLSSPSNLQILSQTIRSGARIFAAGPKTNPLETLNLADQDSQFHYPVRLNGSRASVLILMAKNLIVGFKICYGDKGTMI